MLTSRTTSNLCPGGCLYQWKITTICNVLSRIQLSSLHDSSQSVSHFQKITILAGPCDMLPEISIYLNPSSSFFSDLSGTNHFYCRSPITHHGCPFPSKKFGAPFDKSTMTMTMTTTKRGAMIQNNNFTTYWSFHPSNLATLSATKPNVAKDEKPT